MSKINYMHLSFGDLYINEYSQAPDVTKANVFLTTHSNKKLLGRIKLRDQNCWISIPVDDYNDKI